MSCNKDHDNLATQEAGYTAPEARAAGAMGAAVVEAVQNQQATRNARAAAVLGAPVAPAPPAPAEAAAPAEPTPPTDAPHPNGNLLRGWEHTRQSALRDYRAAVTKRQKAGDKHAKMLEKTPDPREALQSKERAALNETERAQQVAGKALLKAAAERPAQVENCPECGEFMARNGGHVCDPRLPRFNARRAEGGPPTTLATCGLSLWNRQEKSKRLLGDYLAAHGDVQEAEGEWLMVDVPRDFAAYLVNTETGRAYRTGRGHWGRELFKRVQTAAGRTNELKGAQSLWAADCLDKAEAADGERPSEAAVADAMKMHAGREPRESLWDNYPGLAIRHMDGAAREYWRVKARRVEVAKAKFEPQADKGYYRHVFDADHKAKFELVEKAQPLDTAQIAPHLKKANEVFPMFISRGHNGKRWTVTEAHTGLAIGTGGKTQKEAIEQARAALQGRSAAELDDIVRESVVKYGLSPQYAEVGSRAARCGGCGQYRTPEGPHTCPPAAKAAWQTRQTARLPEVSGVRRALEAEVRRLTPQAGEMWDKGQTRHTLVTRLAQARAALGQVSRALARGQADEALAAARSAGVRRCGLCGEFRGEQHTCDPQQKAAYQEAHPYQDGYPAMFADGEAFAEWLQQESANTPFGTPANWHSLPEVRSFDQQYLALFTEDETDSAQVAAHLRSIMRGTLAIPDESFQPVVPTAGGPARSRLHLFKCDWTASGRTDFFTEAWDALETQLREGTPVRLTNRAGPGTQGTRKHEGLGTRFQLAFANQRETDDQAVKADVQNYERALAEAGITLREAYAAALGQLHEYLPRCSCGRFMSPTSPVCQNPSHQAHKDGLFGKVQKSKRRGWPPANLTFKKYQTAMVEGDALVTEAVAEAPAATVTDEAFTPEPAAPVAEMGAGGNGAQPPSEPPASDPRGDEAYEAYRRQVLETLQGEADPEALGFIGDAEMEQAQVKGQTPKDFALGLLAADGLPRRDDVDFAAYRDAVEATFQNELAIGVADTGLDGEELRARMRAGESPLEVAEWVAEKYGLDAAISKTQPGEFLSVTHAEKGVMAPGAEKTVNGATYRLEPNGLVWRRTAAAELYTCGNCGHEFIPRSTADGAPTRCPECGMGSAGSGAGEEEGETFIAPEGEAPAPVQPNPPPQAAQQFAAWQGQNPTAPRDLTLGEQLVNALRQNPLTAWVADLLNDVLGWPRGARTPDVAAGLTLTVPELVQAANHADTATLSDEAARVLDAVAADAPTAAGRDEATRPDLVARAADYQRARAEGDAASQAATGVALAQEALRGAARCPTCGAFMNAVTGCLEPHATAAPVNVEAAPAAPASESPAAPDDQAPLPVTAPAEMPAAPTFAPLEPSTEPVVIVSRVVKPKKEDDERDVEFAFRQGGFVFRPQSTDKQTVVDNDVSWGWDKVKPKDRERLQKWDGKEGKQAERFARLKALESMDATATMAEVRGRTGKCPDCARFVNDKGEGHKPKCKSVGQAPALPEAVAAPVNDQAAPEAPVAPVGQATPAPVAAVAPVVPTVVDPAAETTLKTAMGNLVRTQRKIANFWHTHPHGQSPAALAEYRALQAQVTADREQARTALGAGATPANLGPTERMELELIREVDRQARVPSVPQPTTPETLQAMHDIQTGALNDILKVKKPRELDAAAYADYAALVGLERTGFDRLSGQRKLNALQAAARRQLADRSTALATKLETLDSLQTWAATDPTFGPGHYAVLPNPSTVEVYDAEGQLTARYPASVAERVARRHTRHLYTCGQCGHKFVPRAASEGAPVRCPAPNCGTAAEVAPLCYPGETTWPGARFTTGGADYQLLPDAGDGSVQIQDVTAPGHKPRRFGSRKSFERETGLGLPAGFAERPALPAEASPVETAVAHLRAYVEADELSSEDLFVAPGTLEVDPAQRPQFEAAQAEAEARRDTARQQWHALSATDQMAAFAHLHAEETFVLRDLGFPSATVQAAAGVVKAKAAPAVTPPPAAAAPAPAPVVAASAPGGLDVMARLAALQGQMATLQQQNAELDRQLAAELAEE